MHREKNFFLKILLLFCLLLITSACSTQNTPIPIPSILPPSSAPTLSSTSDITPTALPIQQFTSTPHPSQTATLILPTRTAQVDNKVTPTKDAVEIHTTQTARFPIICKSDNDIKHHSSFSPDINWLAISCSDDLDSTLEIVNLTGKRWVLRYVDYVAKEFKDGRGSLNPIQWLNGNYLT